MAPPMLRVFRTLLVAAAIIVWFFWIHQSNGSNNGRHHIPGTPRKAPKDKPHNNNNNNSSVSPPYNLTTNPLSLTSPIHHGPWKIIMPPTIRTGEQLTITIICTSDSPAECPSAYYIQLYGPTTHTVPHSAFKPPAPGRGSRKVTVRTILNTPGEYNVYAYPNAASCNSQNGKGAPETRLYRRLVAGTPAGLTVVGDPSFPSPPADACTDTSDVLSGHWTRTEGYSYEWTPHHCHLPRRSAKDVLEALPDVKTLLFIGDSVTSGYLCAFVYPQLFGSAKGDCQGAGVIPKHDNQAAVYTRPNSNEQVAVRFLFTGAEGIAGIEAELKTVVGPVLVVYNGGLWMSSRNETEVKSEYSAFFAAVERHWPDPRQARVVVRSTTSVVQPITCFDNGGHGRGRSLQLRKWLWQVTNEWKEEKEEKKEGLGARVAFVDAFDFTDSRPETTLDGFHWSPPDSVVVVKGYASWDKTVRPMAGEAEEWVMNWVWDEAVKMKE